MRARGRCGGRLATAMGVVALVLPASAFADGKRVSDPNDVAHALDIRSVAHGHAGRRITHTLTTFGSFSSSFLRGGDNFVGFGFDTNGSRSTAERFVFVFWARGALRAVVTTGSGNAIAGVPVSRPSRRTVRVSIPTSRLGSPVGYRWAAFSFVGARGDGAPNRRLVLHDVTAPRIVLRSFPRVPADVAYDVVFKVADAGGAGLRRWRLQHRALGSNTWATIDDGTTRGTKTVHVVSSEDADDVFRIIAVDRQGNQRVSPTRLVTVPLDDTTLFSSGSSMGTWTLGGTSGDFRGTLHTTTDLGPPPASIAFSWDGGYLAIIGPTGANALDTEGSLFVDELLVDTFQPDDMTTGRRRILFTHEAAPGAYTVRIEAAGTGLVLDGIITR